ncbi:MAG TPA: thiamine phosphate synthase [Nitrospirae bacterium]|nr:thiamine phosphate synthase [Nitrospirota bacterium]
MSLFSNSPLYLITNRNISGLTHTRIARRATTAGIKTIQLREKHLLKKEIYKEALTVREITKRHKVTFIINDYIDIALAVDADGVHLGQEDMPLKEARKILGRQKIIGISTHTLREAIEAQDTGADYIGFGPMFHTITKDAGRPKGIKSLREISRHINIPVVAIGGITWENVKEVLNSGADAAAVASGILSGDIKTNLKRFFEAMT